MLDQINKKRIEEPASFFGFKSPRPARQLGLMSSVCTNITLLATFKSVEEALKLLPKTATVQLESLSINFYWERRIETLSFLLLKDITSLSKECEIKIPYLEIDRDLGYKILFTRDSIAIDSRYEITKVSINEKSGE